MKRNLIALLLVAVLVLSMGLLTAFTRFIDVSEAQWYAGDVADVQRYGLINGVGDDRFDPDGTLTLAQAITLASRLHAYNNGLSIDTGTDGAWYDPYLAYAENHGLCGRGEFGADYNSPCTRLTMAKLFYRAFPMDTAQQRNNVTSLPDTADGSVLFLYQQGVLTGNDPYGTFAPDRSITRAETAAILNRLLDPAKRKTFTLQEKAVAPVSLQLKYDGGGADSKWYVQEATIGAPVYTDLDGDGSMELLFSARSLFCLDPASGRTKWRVASGHDRSVPSDTADFGRTGADLQVLDIDGDGAKEIVSVHTDYSKGQSCVAVYDCNGYFKAGWPLYTDYPVRAMTVSDMDRDGRCEVILGLGVGEAGWHSAPNAVPSLYIYEPDGTIRAGWPQNCDYGLFADTFTTTDLDGDGIRELVTLYDGEHARAFHADGREVIATGGEYAGLGWNFLPVCESYAHELICVRWARDHGGKAFASDDSILGPSRSDKNCIAGTVGGVAAVDMDGNGTEELVYTAMMVDGSVLMRSNVNSYEGVALYYTTFILNKDRTRYVNAAKGFDWTQMPIDPAPIATLDTYLIPAADMAPTTADLDGDGNREILYSANDGQVHCFGLNGRQNDHWPFTLCTASSPIKEFASRPVCADVNGDGLPEVIFATYTQNNQTTKRGSLYVLDGKGNVLGQAVIPVTYASDADLGIANGCMAPPCVGDFDGDGRMEIALTTLRSGLIVYDVN